MHLDEITDDRVRKLIGELSSKLKPHSIRNCLNIVSRIFNDQPRALRLTNPVAALDRYDRKSIGAGWDPKKTPWLRTEQVRAVYLALPELAPKAPWRAMFALGTFAGLRTGEVVALEPGAFTERERALVEVSLAPAKILPLSAPVGA